MKKKLERGDYKPLGTPASYFVTYPDHEYMMFRPGVTDEEIYLEWWHPKKPKEIVRTGGCVLVGPLPEKHRQNGRHDDAEA